MNALDSNAIALIAGYLKGKRREKFELAISLLRDSIANEGWTVPRAAIKVGSGLYQGIAQVPYRSGGSSERFELGQCLSYGHALRADIEPSDQWLGELAPRLPLDVAWAWISLCRAAHAAIKALDAARPKPVITPIGLSPKVTKTLTECNLDLDLPSIKPAKIAFYERPLVVLTNDGAPVCALTSKCEPMIEKVYYPAWTLEIKHRVSRFAHSGGCEACGKRIPSGRYVPVEATCKRNGLISMWLGCDCARNIFGIKDVGVAREAQP